MTTADQALLEVSMHLEAFAKAAKIDRNLVFVRLTLGDGSSFYVRGLNVSKPLGDSRWVMVSGSPPDSLLAWVVPEGHIIRAEFEIEPEAPEPFGFQPPAKK